MPDAALNIAYALPDDTERLPPLRVTLEPEFVGSRENLADLGDVDAMLAAAMGGLSARSRQMDRCRWLSWNDNGEAVVTLDLYVWPSQTGLEYTLDLPAGVSSSPAETYSRSRVWKYWISDSGHLDLPWRLEPATTYWHPAIGCLDAWSRQIAPPAIEHRGASLEMDGKAYGVLVVDGVAHGYLHRISISLQKLVQGAGGTEINRIEIDKIPVAAAWTDEKGESQTTSADMIVPACVRELLAACNGKPEVIFSISDERYRPWTIYYDACTGNMLARVRAKE